MNTGGCKDGLHSYDGHRDLEHRGIMSADEMKGHSQRNKHIDVELGGIESTFACESIGMYLTDAV